MRGGRDKKNGLRKEKAFRMFMSVQSRFALVLVCSVLNFYFYLCLDIATKSLLSEVPYVIVGL